MVFAVSIINDGGDLYREEVYRALSALMVAWHRGIEGNLIVGKEVNLEGLTYRFDYVLYSIDVPINIKGIIKGKRPVAIIEDSRDLKRLRSRHRELGKVLAKLGVDGLYVYVTEPDYIENLIGQEVLRLGTMTYGNNWYVLGVNV
jgi:hypothetical protein